MLGEFSRICADVFIWFCFRCLKELGFRANRVQETWFFVALPNQLRSN
jgi:hypothetical protein